jgi:hypothetical protein
VMGTWKSIQDKFVPDWAVAILGVFLGLLAVLVVVLAAIAGSEPVKEQVVVCGGCSGRLRNAEC